MIDPRYITNENLFSLDYSGDERRAALAKLYHELDELDELDARESRRSHPSIAAFQLLLHRFGMRPIKAAFQKNTTHYDDEEGR